MEISCKRARKKMNFLCECDGARNNHEDGGLGTIWQLHLNISIIILKKSVPSNATKKKCVVQRVGGGGSSNSINGRTMFPK